MISGQKRRYFSQLLLESNEKLQAPVVAATRVYVVSAVLTVFTGIVLFLTVNSVPISSDWPSEYDYSTQQYDFLVVFLEFREESSTFYGCSLR